MSPQWVPAVAVPRGSLVRDSTVPGDDGEPAPPLPCRPQSQMPLGVKSHVSAFPRKKSVFLVVGQLQPLIQWPALCLGGVLPFPG